MTRAALDPTDPTLRILECTSCATPVGGTPEDALFVATCPACGVENRRELRAVTTAATAFAHGYRSAAPLAQQLPDVPFARPEGTPRFFSYPKWRALIPDARKALATATDAERAVRAEHLFWYQMTLTGAYLQRGDLLRARAALESAFEDHDQPFYRGIVLTRLARIATISRGDDARRTALATAWLDRLPAELEPDLAEEVLLTRAMIDRHRTPPKELLAMLDERTFRSGAHGLATALRVDALERNGDYRAAYRAYRAGIRGRARLVNGAFRMYRLAPATFAHAAALKQSATVVGLAGGLYGILELTNRPGSPIALAFFVLVAIAFAFRALRGPRP